MEDIEVGEKEYNIQMEKEKIANAKEQEMIDKEKDKEKEEQKKVLDVKEPDEIIEDGGDDTNENKG